MNAKTLTIIILIAIALTACAPAQDAQPIEPLKIGLVLPLTGPAAELGNAYLQGATLAVEDLNSAKVLNRQITLIVEDTVSEPRNAVTAMQKLINVDEVKFFATIASSHGLVLKSVAVENKVLLFGDVAHPNMTGDNPFTFRHSNIAEEEAQKMAQKAMALGAQRVGILYGNDDYGYVLNKNLVQYLNKAGVLTKSEAFDLKSTDFKTEIAKATSAVDVVILAGLGPAFNIALKQIKGARFEGDVIAGIGFVIFNSANLGETVDGFYHSDYPYTFLDKWDEFATKYKTKYGKEPQPFNAIPYGTMELLVHAIAKADSDDPATVAETLRSMGEFKGTYETIKLNDRGDAVIPLIVTQFRAQE